MTMMMSSSVGLGALNPAIDIGEGLRDSPKFRSALDDKMGIVESIEGRVEKLLKISQNMIDTGKTYLSLQYSFNASLVELKNTFSKEETFIHLALGNMANDLKELAKFQNTLLDQINRAICQNLEQFLKTDIRGVKDCRSALDKTHSEYESALHRNSVIPCKGKIIEAEEASNSLLLAKKNHRNSAIKTIVSLTIFQEKKRVEVCDGIMNMINAYKTFFHQGSDYLKDSEKSRKVYSSTSAEIRSKIPVDANKTMLNLSSLIASTPDFSSRPSSSPSTLMEGYLFRRNSSKTFKSWKRRWFELLESGQFIYRKRLEESPSIMEEDLRICLVRPMADCDRRFCFELISPNKTHILQAESEEVFIAWFTTLQSAITSAIHNSPLTHRKNNDSILPSTSSNSSNSTSPFQALLLSSSQKSKVITTILSVDGNTRCCDCGASEPEWASANLGITLCIECSGIHRSLGVHYSKVKSLKLDSWEPGTLKVMSELGNNLVNGIYLAKADVVQRLGIEKASPHSSREERETWIRAKYVDRAFVASPKSNSDENNFSKNSPNRKQDKKMRKIKKSATAGSSETDSFKSCASETSPENLDLNLSHNTETNPNLGEKNDEKKETVSDEEEDEESFLESYENLDANELLYKGSRVGNLGLMAEALALGADRNWININDQGSTPLHQATLGGSVSAAEFLLLNGSKVNVTDSQGRSPLYIATELGHTGQICLFLRNRADHHLSDTSGKSPLELALSSENADIVTLLRLAQMDEEMRSGESSSDDTFQEIVRDIATRALNSDNNSTNTLSASSLS